MKTNHPLLSLKTLLLLILLLFGYRKSEAQYVTIPDPNFVAILQQYYPACMVGNQMDTTCSDIINAGAFGIYNVPSVYDLTGIQYFDNLSQLDVEMTSLTYVPAWPPLLNWLQLDSNLLLSSIPPLPETMDYLSMESCHFSTMPVLNAGLKTLLCDRNILTSLGELPSVLQTLDCSDNLLTSLPAFYNTSYEYIDISNNPISCFPGITGSIQSLRFCNTLITCLPADLDVNFIDNCGDPIPPTCLYQTDCGSYNFSGRAFKDLNDNCVFDGNDVPIKSAIISANNGSYYTVTDSEGIYRMYVGFPGSYQLSQVINYPQLEDVICYSNEHDTSIVNSIDTVVGLDFPNKIINECPLMTVDLATEFQRYCFGNNTYTVYYCNVGNDTAVDASIEIEFDAEIIPLISTLPWSSVDGNIYTWLLGDIPPGFCNSFMITDSIPCDAIIGQTACAKANIYPQGDCTDTSALWDHSDLVAKGYCNATNDTIVLSFVNQGSGTVTYQADAVIYEDDLLLFSFDTTNIQPGDSVVVKHPATGKTYRLEVNQHPNHPGHSMPRDFQELCGVEPYSLGHIVPIPQDDEDDWVEIDCHEIVASYDPNEKSAQPSGVGVNHYITSDDMIDYTIQFQNTGTDTAFNIVLIDTLDAVHLDVTSIQLGASSHPYDFSLFGPGIAEFKFSNILLPDSNINEPASHGYVKYKIRQNPGNTPGMVINNSADIYFDFNDAVQTNNVFLTVQDKDSIFLPVSVQDPVSLDPTKTVIVFPLPFSDQVTFKVLGKSPDSKLQLRITDVYGKVVYESEKQNHTVIEVDHFHLPAGSYVYIISEDERKIATGKLVVGK